MNDKKVNSVTKFFILLRIKYMKRLSITFALLVVLAMHGISATPDISVTLGSAATVGSLGGSAGLTNQGLSTVINGDIGTTAASSLITGFHDAGANTFTETPLNVGAVNGTINCAAPLPGTTAATRTLPLQHGIIST